MWSRDSAKRVGWQDQRPWLILALVVAAASFALRLLWLTTIPGMNGDEAAGGVLIRQWLAGHARAPWVTQTNRFVAVFNLLAAIFYRVGPPSYWQLRLLPCVVGYLTVIAVWFAARAVFARYWVRMGVVLTAACLPIQLAYARIAWDPCMTSLGPLLFVVLVLRGRYAWSLLGAAVGFLIHPTIAFLAPYGALCLIAEVLPRFFKTRHAQALVVVGTLIAAIPVLSLLYRAFIGPGGTGPRLDAYSWSTLKNFLLLMGGVISGSVPAEAFVTKPTGGAADAFRVINATIIVALCVVALRVVRRSNLPWRRRLFPLGVLIGMAMMYVLNPLQDAGHDRYTLGLILPIVFCFGIAADSARHVPAAEQPVAVVIPALLLVSYGIFYVGAARKTGGVQYSTYQTGPVEPKLAAEQWIIADLAQRPQQTAHIVVDSWWVFWPIRYLTLDHPQVQVHHYQEPDPNMPPDARIGSPRQLEQVLSNNGYAVGFSNDTLAKVTPHLQLSRICAEQTFVDYAGRPSVTVRRMCSRR